MLLFHTAAKAFYISRHVPCLRFGLVWPSRKLIQLETVMTTTLPPKSSKGYKGLGMEGRIARWYARTTAYQDRHKSTAETVASQVAPGGSVLEIAPGPGYLAIELARLSVGRVVGLDISKTFVEIASANARAASTAVEFVHGNASEMPFAADTFDFIVCQAAFKNFSEPVRALCEMHRVLRPGGKALILDLRPDAAPTAINAEVRRMGLGWFGSLLNRLIFKSCLLKRAYSRDQFEDMVSQSPFVTCEIDEVPIGFAVSLTKHK
jgi:ubiquinone/menaquinone biosynthesis C-methylase UbiE